MNYQRSGDPCSGFFDAGGAKGVRPKVMFVVAEDWYFVSHRLPLALKAREAGFEVLVATPVDQHGARIEAAGLKLLPITFNRSGTRPIEETVTLARLVSLYRKWQPDIVHHVALKPVLYGSIAARLAGIRGIVNALGGLGYVFQSKGLRARLLRSLVKPSLRLALGGPHMRLIVQNSDDQRRIVEGGLAPADSVRLIRGSGVDLRRYRRVQEAEIPLVIFPARFLRDKGIVEFVEAATLLRQRGVKARFVLAGKRDPANPACIEEDLLAAWHRQGMIELWGWQDDMPNVFSQAQIVCLPSYHEGLPKVLLEAAASYCAIVATDIPGCREIVRQGVTGWLVPVRDSVRLADALQEAIEHPELRRNYALAAYSVVEADFTVDCIVAKTLNIYREILGAVSPC
jgi:glycosyltransferase involved in cell wall biosynthesis